MKGHLNHYLETLEKQTNSSNVNSDDLLGSKEKEDFESREKNQELKHKAETHKQYMANEQQNTKLRLKFANKVFWLTVWTLIVIGLLIAGNGIAHLFKKEFLSDQNLIALISFSSVDMLGIFAIILAYLFNRGR